MALALCLLLVVPAHRRPLAACAGAVFALAEGFGLMVMGWHYPSDVLAGVGVATAWAALGVAVLQRAPVRRRQERPEPASVTSNVVDSSAVESPPTQTSNVEASITQSRAAAFQ